MPADSVEAALDAALVAALNEMIVVVRGWLPGAGVGGSTVRSGDGPPLVRQRTAGALALAVAASKIGHSATTEPLRRSSGGRPVWSPDVVGAVTHDAELALAVLADRAFYAGLGVDVERRGGLRTDESRDVLLTDGERWSAVDDLDPTIRFAAKEAAFKAWAGVLDATPPLDLTRIPVTFDADSFSASVRVGEQPLEMQGRWTRVGDRILTAACAPGTLPDVGNIGDLRGG